MKFRHIITAIALAFSATTHLYAQDSTYSISTPIEIPKEGWNKVVQLRNGNTVLLHFENKKGIVVKVFDKDRKEIASKKHLCTILDINGLDKAYFDGVYDINGEAVMFATQDVDNARTLIKLRFDGKTGALLAEEKAVTSKSFKSMTTAYVLKPSNREGYSLVTYHNDDAFDSLNVTVIQLNDRHETVQEVAYHLDYSKKYDMVRYISSSAGEDGSVIFVLEASKIIQQGGTINKTLLMGYLPANGDKVLIKPINLPPNTTVRDLEYAHNPLNNNLHFIYSTVEGYVPEENGIRGNITAAYDESLLLMPPGLNGLIRKNLDNVKAAEYLGAQKADSLLRNGVQYFNMDDDGNTIIVARERNYKDIIGKKENAGKRYGRIIITKYDPAGNELWATVIPKSHCVKEDQRYPTAFRRTSRLSLESTLQVSTGNKFFIFHNDVESNFDKTVSSPIDAYDDHYVTNCYYYSIDRDNNVKKERLFPFVEGAYKQIYPNSADYNHANKMLALLVHSNKGTEETFHIAWKKLEN